MKIYQVDAFTDHVFGGNPAAVCPLEKWISNELMQNIAMENNLAETAFFVKNGDDYELRWFTPLSEVDLCGHATLASAHVLFEHLRYRSETINFLSPRSGRLTVKKESGFLTLNFPADILVKENDTHKFRGLFSKDPIEVYKGKTDLLFIYDSEKEIRELIPDIRAILKLDARGIIVSARGDNSDFVSRFFAPQVGIDEDPVTGSAHTTLTPYWHHRLNKTELSAIQLSSRTGILKCKFLNERTEISGQAKTYLVGDIFF